MGKIEEGHMLDPQVQIKIIELATQWAKETLQPAPGPRNQQTRIQARITGFELAYTGIAKAILAAESETPK